MSLGVSEAVIQLARRKPGLAMLQNDSKLLRREPAARKMQRAAVVGKGSNPPRPPANWKN